MPTYNHHGRQSDSFWGNDSPPTGPVGTANTWIGIKVKFAVPGRVCGFRDYLTSSFGGNHIVVMVHQDTGLAVCADAFAERSPSSSNGWTQRWVRPWVRIVPTDWYWVWIMHLRGQYFRHTNYLTAGGEVTHGDIVMGNSAQSTNTAPWTLLPTTNQNGNSIDVLFHPD